MRTKTGRLVDDSTLDSWADAFERGDWPQGRTVILGRPSLAAEEIKPVTIKLPVSVITEIDERATASGKTRSEFVRSIIDKELSRIA